MSIDIKIKLPVDLPRLLKDIETAYIDAALEQTNDNKKQAASLLNLKRTCLVEKLRRRIYAAQKPKKSRKRGVAA